VGALQEHLGDTRAYTEVSVDLEHDRACRSGRRHTCYV
jgi:hypothetical protein